MLETRASKKRRVCSIDLRGKRVSLSHLRHLASCFLSQFGLLFSLLFSFGFDIRFILLFFLRSNFDPSTKSDAMLFVLQTNITDNQFN